MAVSLMALKTEVRRLLVEEGMGEALARLKSALPEGADPFDALILLEAELREVNLSKVRGTLSAADLELRYASLRQRLLDLLDTLTEADLSAEIPGAAKRNKQGHLLYQIPDEMEVLQETRCRVRVAFEEGVLLEQIELTRGTEIRDIRVSEVMEVQLLDPSEVPAFAIRTFNRAEQFVETSAFTEWIFFVKPLREGSFPLLLRVSVIEAVGGKERVREIVLEEQVEIVADLEESPDPDAGFRPSGVILGSDQPAPAASTRRKFSRLATILSGILILTVIGLNFLTRNFQSGSSAPMEIILEETGTETPDPGRDPGKSNFYFLDSTAVDTLVPIDL